MNKIWLRGDTSLISNSIMTYNFFGDIDMPPIYRIHQACILYAKIFADT